MPVKNILNPFNPLYQDDTLLSDRPEIQELNEFALELEDKIEGDFDLEYMVFQIAHNQLAYVRTGLLLAKLKFLKLYKEWGDGTFASFCRDRLHKLRWQINDNIKAARVAMELIYSGFEILPANISQALALAKFSGEELIEKWQKVIDNIPLQQITTKSIRNLLFPPSEKDLPTSKIVVPHHVYDRIYREAIDRAVSVPTLIVMMLEFFLSGGNSHLLTHNSYTKSDSELEDIWQEDLANLTATQPN